MSLLRELGNGGVLGFAFLCKPVKAEIFVEDHPK